MAKRPCARAGCGALVDRGYCPQCRASSPAITHDRLRGSSAARGYDGAWQRARVFYLSLHPVCVDPYRRHVGVIVIATEIDHVIAVESRDDPRFWDETNWQALCHACHSYKTARVDGGLGQVGRGKGAKSLPLGGVE
jgi:5-methylcytosine-specific restriction enzyme A